MVVATSGLVLATSWDSWTGNRGYDWSDPGLLALVAASLSPSRRSSSSSSRAQEPLLPLRLFRNPTFTIATAIGLILGMGMFSAIAFLPTFLQMSTGRGVPSPGSSAPDDGRRHAHRDRLGDRDHQDRSLQDLSGGRPAITAGGIAWLTQLTGDMSMILFGAMIFVFGAGMGLVMQIIVLVVQNSVDPHEIGTATSTNNFFREIGAAVGTALFSTLFTTRLADNLTDVFADAPAGSVDGAAGLTPAVVQSLPEPFRTGVVDAFTNALAPSFWYLVPVVLVGFVLALFLREVKLSDVAGMVARGEALAADGSGTVTDTFEGSTVLDELSAPVHADIPSPHGEPVSDVEAPARR